MNSVLKRNLLTIIVMVLSIIGIIMMLAIPVASYKEDSSSVGPYSTRSAVSIHFINGDIDFHHLGGLDGTYRWNDFYGPRTGVWPSWLILVMLASCLGAFLGGFLALIGPRNQRLVGGILAVVSAFLGGISALVFNSWWSKKVFPILEEEIGDKWTYQGENYIAGFFILGLFSIILLYFNYRSSDVPGVLLEPFSSTQSVASLKNGSSEPRRLSRKRIAYCSACDTSTSRLLSFCPNCGNELDPESLEELPKVLPRSK
ncbi:MAG: hypothetical protein ACXAEL_00315 [Candidatus Hodarchaeales archaeon]